MTPEITEVTMEVAARDGFWFDLPDGKRLWVGEVVSTDALGLRLHFKDVRLPEGAELAVYSPSVSDPGHGIVKNGSPRFDPDRYVEFYGAANSKVQRGDFWTGTHFGDRTRIARQARRDDPRGRDPAADAERFYERITVDCLGDRAAIVRAGEEATAAADLEPEQPQRRIVGRQV